MRHASRRSATRDVTVLRARLNHAGVGSGPRNTAQRRSSAVLEYRRKSSVPLRSLPREKRSGWAVMRSGVCAECGVGFEYLPQQGGGRPHATCSFSCKVARRNRWARERKRRAPAKPKVERYALCECGKRRRKSKPACYWCLHPPKTVVARAFCRCGSTLPPKPKGQPGNPPVWCKECRRTGRYKAKKGRCSCGAHIFSKSKECSACHAVSRRSKFPLVCSCGKRKSYKAKHCQVCATEIQVSKWQEWRKRTCTLCGNAFTLKKDSGSKGLVCSRECYFKHLSLRTQHKERAKAAKRLEIELDREQRALARTRPCDACGNPFVAHTALSRFCSRDCRKGSRFRRKRVERACVECGTVFMAGFSTITRCPLHQKRSTRRQYRRKHGHSGKIRNRAIRFGVQYVKGISRTKLFERDGWRCVLCGCSTPKRLIGKNHPRSPTIDHIVPMSMGGAHTWDNIQLACRDCNTRKSTRTVGQLRLGLESVSC